MTEIGWALQGPARFNKEKDMDFDGLIEGLDMLNRWWWGLVFAGILNLI